MAAVSPPESALVVAGVLLVLIALKVGGRDYTAAEGSSLPRMRSLSLLMTLRNSLGAK
jgi:hypothetical protein